MKSTGLASYFSAFMLVFELDIGTLLLAGLTFTFGLRYVYELTIYLGYYYATRRRQRHH